MKFPRAMYSLRMSFWAVPRSFSGVDALLLADELVEQQQHRRGRVDRHRGRDLVERDAVERGPHVVERVDRDAGAPDLAEAARVVGVEAELGRQVEGHREALGAVREQVLVALVGLLRRRVARVLAHRPQLLAVHLAVRPARERELAGLAEPLLQVLGHVAGLVQRLDLDARVREAARVVGSDDRRDGEVGGFLEVLVVDGHAWEVRIARWSRLTSSPPIKPPSRSPAAPPRYHPGPRPDRAGAPAQRRQPRRRPDARPPRDRQPDVGLDSEGLGRRLARHRSHREHRALAQRQRAQPPGRRVLAVQADRGAARLLPLVLRGVHAQGLETRWALAASIVAGGAADGAWARDAEQGRATGASSNEVQGMMRIGNQVIFDNVSRS